MVETDFLPVNYEIMPLFSDKISIDDKGDKAAQTNKSEHYLVSLSQKIKKLEKRVYTHPLQSLYIKNNTRQQNILTNSRSTNRKKHVLVLTKKTQLNSWIKLSPNKTTIYEYLITFVS